MISVEEALSIIMDQKIDYGVESVPYAASLGRINAEPWHADRPLPPYDRVTMDGIAIHFQAYSQGRRNFQIDGIAPAGSPQKTLLDSSVSIEVMTGGVLPIGTDTVIRYEDLSINKGFARIQAEHIRQGQNIHYRGEDLHAGDIVLSKHQIITPACIGIASAIGLSSIQVLAHPKILVISTGNELVEVDQKPLIHQIRRSNIHQIRASLQKWKVQSEEVHLIDNKQDIINYLDRAAEKYDVFILSGGVSKGKYDFIPEALEAIGVKKEFHKVAQRPGKPFWFGRSEKRNLTVFALPGNPVSSFVCLHRYFIPWILDQLKQETSLSWAFLGEDIEFKPKLTRFIPARKKIMKGKLWVQPISGNGSGDLTSIVGGEVLIQFPAQITYFKKGELVGFIDC